MGWRRPVDSVRNITSAAFRRARRAYLRATAPHLLLYTDSRGKNVKGFTGYPHYSARLAEEFYVDAYLCPEKWTTTLDFLRLWESLPHHDYDAVILHTNVVDASPRHQTVAIERIYQDKKAIFDEVFGAQAMREHLQHDLGVEYEGDRTVNLYSLEMARRCLLPRLLRIPNLIWISGNRIAPGYQGSYPRPRPANISLVEPYFDLFADTLPHVVRAPLHWSAEEVRHHTCDNIHPNHTGSDLIYDELVVRIAQVLEQGQKATRPRAA